MNKNEVKRVFRMFTIADYDKEEEFLREQHKAGFKFVRFQFPGFYYFEACEPEDVVYQLDFNDNIRKQDKADYLQLYKDTGWEYMFDVFEWSYFRKSASLEEEEPTIFTDKESKIELINRVFKRRMLPIIIAFFCYLGKSWIAKTFLFPPTPTCTRSPPSGRSSPHPEYSPAAPWTGRPPQRYLCQSPLQ